MISPRLLYLTFILFGIIQSGKSQNLVRNGGFEKFYNCPDNYTVEYNKRFLPSWIMPTKGTPDYFNRCSKEMVGVPQNFMGSIFPAEGDGFIGLVLLDTPEITEEIDYRDYVRSGPLMPVTITNANVKKPNTKRKVKPINYREYVQTQLISPLQPKQLYRISFKYALAQHSTFVSNRLGVVFTHNPITQKKGVLPYKPVICIDTVVLFSTPGIWVEHSDTFRTRGGEMYMTIGNFYEDAQCRFIPNDISSLNTSLQRTILENQIAYYYIDDVRLEPVFEPENLSLSPRFIPFSLLKRSEYLKIDTMGARYAILDEVYFDIGKPGTKPRSLCQLDGLVKFLSDNPGIGVELNGFMHEFEMDTLGSMSRIHSFIDFLCNHGVDGSRITTSTFNDLKPISKKYNFSCESIPCALYASLFAIRFYKLN